MLFLEDFFEVCSKLLFEFIEVVFELFEIIFESIFVFWDWVFIKLLLVILFEVIDFEILTFFAK